MSKQRDLSRVAWEVFHMSEGKSLLNQSESLHHHQSQNIERRD